MLTLEPSQLIGRGLRRECYFHPSDEKKCVKVVVAGDQTETAREQFYYGLLAKRAISWEMLARFYGNSETNRGPGAVFELIRDYDGEVSKTLAHYLSATHDTGLDFRKLPRALATLKRYLLQWKIMTMSIKPDNIVFKKTSASEGKLVVIDNIGNSDFIPICNYVAFMARRKILRKWQRLEQTLAQNYPHNQNLQLVLKKSKYA